MYFQVEEEIKNALVHVLGGERSEVEADILIEYLDHDEDGEVALEALHTLLDELRDGDSSRRDIFKRIGDNSD